MSRIAAAWTDGARRVGRAPAITTGVYLLLLFAAGLPALVVREDVSAAFGSSAASETMATGVNLEWWEQFGESASGLSRSFSPTIIGFGAPLDNLSRVADHGALPVAVMAVVGVVLLCWLFLTGGILDRFARDRAVRRQVFFGACGQYFPRLLRLGLIGLAGYWLLFGYVHAWLFDRLWGAATHDLTVERTAFVLRLACYAVFGSLVALWNLVLDYAKIRTVIEDRISMLGALVAAWRFVAGNPGIVGGLYAANILCFGVVLAGYALVAPGAAGGGVQVWAGLAVAQGYIAARVLAKLVFAASQTALFQQTLAHAAYTAAPVRSWPESPAAERIVNAAERRP